MREGENTRKDRGSDAKKGIGNNRKKGGRFRALVET